MPVPAGSGRGFWRPYVIVSANSFNESRINTVIAVVVTPNLRLAEAPGNVRLSSRGTGLSKPLVANVLQVITIDKSFLTERIGRVPQGSMSEIDDGYGFRLRSKLKARANASTASCL